ncbi:hypothetical protein, partial [Actinomadura fibrosa]|uniref:hypothetical protein n=1 Tax=Actinomadura fibrosa TaxID=111802 RepID=UPI001A955896
MHLLADGQQPAPPPVLSVAALLPIASRNAARVIAIVTFIRVALPAPRAYGLVGAGVRPVSAAVTEDGLVPLLLGPAQVGAQAAGGRPVARRDGAAH